MGDVRDFRNFMGAVIDKRAFDKISGYIAEAKRRPPRSSPGGDVDGAQGLLHRADAGRDDRPGLQAPVRGDLRTGASRVHVYPDEKWSETLADRRPHVALRADRRRSSRRDRAAIARGHAARCATPAGNFYVNDKPTGAVVGQQPFGGARASGTNDKAGSKLNLAAVGQRRARSRRRSCRRRTTAIRSWPRNRNSRRIEHPAAWIASGSVSPPPERETEGPGGRARCNLSSNCARRRAHAAAL